MKTTLLALALFVASLMAPLHSAASAVYVTSLDTGEVRKYDELGNPTLVASGFDRPIAIKLDSHGNLYVAELDPAQVFRIDEAGNVSLFSTDVPATSLFDFAVAPEGNVFFLGKVGEGGDIRIFELHENGPTTELAKVPFARGITIGPGGNLYAVTQSEGGGLVLEVTRAGVVSTYFDSGLPDVERNFYSARFSPAGELFIMGRCIGCGAGLNPSVIRKLTADTLTTFAYAGPGTGHFTRDAVGNLLIGMNNDANTGADIRVMDSVGNLTTLVPATSAVFSIDDDCFDFESCGDGSVQTGEECDDANNADGDGCSSCCRDEALPENGNANVVPFVPFTTDGEADGATVLDPVETTVTSPNAGTVDVAESADWAPATNGYQLFGLQIQITAPAATTAAPLVLTFRIDESRVPTGVAVADIIVFRNGTSIGECPGSTVASPDPCISSRTIVGDDFEITALTSAASEWTFGLPTPITGSKLLIKDNSDAAKRRALFLSKSSAITAPEPNSINDPTCGAPGGGGASLEIVGTAESGQTLQMNLPCENWTLVGNPSAPKGYKYKDPEQDQGPCKGVTLLDGKIIKAVCSGKNPSSPLAYDLIAGEGSVAVRLTTGSTWRGCTEFSAERAVVSRDDAQAFLAKNAAAPASCPIP